jgi:hypothetical protein
MDVPKRCVNGACLTAEERLSQSFITTGDDADARRSQSDRRRIDVIGESDGQHDDIMRRASTGFPFIASRLPLSTS